MLDHQSEKMKNDFGLTVFKQIKENKRSTILLRTQLSVRVHTCVGKSSREINNQYLNKIA